MNISKQLEEASAQYNAGIIYQCRSTLIHKEEIEQKHFNVIKFDRTK